MACGCVDNGCTCVISGGSGVTVSGAGSVANPFVVSAIPGASETSWTGANTDGGITITPGGTNGHSPVINLNLDPASPAPLSVSVDGLSVECCPSEVLLTQIDDDAALTDESQVVLVDSTINTITVTMPTTPTLGQEIRIFDAGNAGLGNASVNNITLDFTGHTYFGVPFAFSITTDSGSINLIHLGSNNWVDSI